MNRRSKSRQPPVRERQVSDLLAAGRSDREIADALGISIGSVHMHRYRASRRRDAAARLSKRQREVVSCLALGLTIEEVARHLGIARGTAVNHRTLAALSLGVRSTVALTHHAIVEGWILAGEALSAEGIETALRRIADAAERE